MYQYRCSCDVMKLVGLFLNHSVHCIHIICVVLLQVHVVRFNDQLRCSTCMMPDVSY